MRAFFVSLVMAACLMAQKAEPLAIEFPAGKTTATVRGELRGRQQTEYAVKAREGQAITMQLASAPAGSLRVKLYDPRGTETALRQLSSRRWTAAAAQAGDYTIAVIRASERPEQSTYTLIVTVR